MRAARTPRSRSARRARLAIAALAAAGAAGLAAAALTGTGGGRGDDVTVSSNPAVNRLMPERGDEVLQQSRVGVDLDARYRLASLVIHLNDRFSDGIDVTAEVSHSSGLNLWEFAPGEGRLIEALSPDANCATAVYALISRPDDTGSISWCFTVS